MLDGIEGLGGVEGWAWWLAALAAALVAAQFGHFVLSRLARRLVRRTRSPMDNFFVERAWRPTRLLFAGFAWFIVLPAMPLERAALVEVARISSLALTFAVGWLLISLSGVMVDWVRASYDLQAADNALARQIHTRVLMLRRVTVAVIGVITACVMLMTFPSLREIGVSLFASAGVAGLVAGLAARPALSNLIAGVQLALAAPIRIDDMVVVEGETGLIEDITSTFVVVRVWDLRRLVVPLSYFIEKPFQNWTRRNSDILGTVFLYVDYAVPVEELRQELLRIIENSPLWDRKVWNLQVTDFKERVVELRCLVSASSSGLAWDLRCHIRECLLEFMQRRHPEALPRFRAELDPPTMAAQPQRRAAE